MHLNCRDLVLSSGGRQLCEDRVLVRPSLAAVIDGATQVVPDAPVPSPSEGTWIADLIMRGLLELEGSTTDPRALLCRLSRRIASELEALRWPAERVPPVCSIGILLIRDDHLAAAILGDISLIYRNRASGRTVRVFNGQFLQNERAAFKSQDTADPQRRHAQIQGILERRKLYIDGMSGAGILSANESSVRTAICSSGIQAGDGDALLLASDGFMRLLDLYSVVQTVDDLFSRALRPGGLGGLLELLRGHESVRTIQSDAHKQTDDAAAALVEVVA